MAAKPLILLCNDDGVHAPGIKALALAIEPLADYVICAPHVERSGSGQALSLTTPLRVERIASNIYACEGTPTDCAMFAILNLLPRKPDWILSGINRGSNIGQDTLYSGTVAAAMEGCLHGVPAIAVSLKNSRAFELTDYSDAVHVVRTLFKHADLLASAKGGVLNVNIPPVPLADMRGFKVCGLGRRVYDAQIVESVDPRGRPYYWIGGGGGEFVDIPGSDCVLLEQNFVTLTVLQPDHVHLAANDAMSSAIGNRLDQALKAN